MNRKIACPSCGKALALHQVILCATFDGPAWQCPSCKEAVPRDEWGKTSDGMSAKFIFLYTGPAKSEPFLQKLPRAMTRNATFYGGFVADAKSFERVFFESDKLDSVADYETIGIYHQKEHYMLIGRYYAPRNGAPNKVVLLLSGSGNVAHNYLGKVTHRYLKRVGVAVLLMDYRGFGNSDRKTPSEQGLYTDAEAMWRYLTEDKMLGGLDWSGKKVVIHGYSLGTGVAAELARRRPATGGLVLQCPFTSASAVAEAPGGVVGSIGGGLSRSSAVMEVRGKVGSFPGPVLMLIANQDTAMRGYGEAMAREFSQLPNFTSAHYDGAHEQPENAFKDGGGKTVPKSMTGKGVILSKDVNVRPAPGAVILKDPAGDASPENLKVSTGVGCLGTIVQWYATI